MVAEAGRLEYAMCPGLPRSRARNIRGQIVNLPVGVTPEQVGPGDGERLASFLWRLAGRPLVHASDWKRDRPLYVWMDNSSVHTSQAL